MQRHKKYEYLFARAVGVLLLAFKILKVIKEIHPHSVGRRPSHFSKTLSSQYFRADSLSRSLPRALGSKANWTFQRGVHLCYGYAIGKGYLWQLYGEAMCSDYRPVNQKTKSDWYPMPIPEKLFNGIGFSQVFNTLDLRSGYHQLPLLAGDQVKTAFWGVDRNENNQLYHWKFFPFGLKNAPVEFQRVMDLVISRLRFVRCYIDDVIIFSKTPQDHERHP